MLPTSLFVVWSAVEPHTEQQHMEIRVINDYKKTMYFASLWTEGISAAGGVPQDSSDGSDSTDDSASSSSLFAVCSI